MAECAEPKYLILTSEIFEIQFSDFSKEEEICHWSSVSSALCSWVRVSAKLLIFKGGEDVRCEKQRIDNIHNKCDVWWWYGKLPLWAKISTLHLKPLVQNDWYKKSLREVHPETDTHTYTQTCTFIALIHTVPDNKIHWFGVKTRDTSC